MPRTLAGERPLAQQRAERGRVRQVLPVDGLGPSAPRLPRSAPLLAHPVRRKMIVYLSRHAGCRLAEISKRSCPSLKSGRYHLFRLIHEGFVKIERGAAYARYHLTPQGLLACERFAVLDQPLAEPILRLTSIREKTVQTLVGRTGSTLAEVLALVETLGTLGLVMVGDGSKVRYVRCTQEGRRAITSNPLRR